MSIRLQGTNSTTTTATSLAFGSNVSAGSLLLCAVFWDYNSGESGWYPTDVYDSLGNSYTYVPDSFTYQGLGGRAALYYCFNTKGAGANTLYADTTTNAPDHSGILIDEFSWPGGAIDGNGAAQNQLITSSGTNTVSSGNVAPSINGDLVYSVTGTITTSLSALAAGTGFTQGTAASSWIGTAYPGALSEYLVQSTAANIAGTFSPTSPYVYFFTIAAAFSPASVATYTLTPEVATFSVTGNSLAFAGNVLTPETAAFVVTASVLNYTATATLTPLTASFVLTENPVALAYSPLLNIAKATFSVITTNVNLQRDAVLTPFPSSIEIASHPVNLEKGSKLYPSVAAFAITSEFIDLVYDRFLIPETAIYAIASSEIELLGGYLLMPEVSEFEIAAPTINLGTDNTLRFVNVILKYERWQCTTT